MAVAADDGQAAFTPHLEYLADGDAAGDAHVIVGDLCPFTPLRPCGSLQTNRTASHFFIFGTSMALTVGRSVTSARVPADVEQNPA